MIEWITRGFLPKQGKDADVPVDSGAANPARNVMSVCDQLQAIHDPLRTALAYLIQLRQLGLVVALPSPSILRDRHTDTQWEPRTDGLRPSFTKPLHDELLFFQ